jgi:hypothetical protein
MSLIAQKAKTKRRLSQVGMQMLEDADGPGSPRRMGSATAAVLQRKRSNQGMIQRKRSDLDQEMVTNRSRSTSGAVIKKSRARPAERRNSTDATDLVLLDDNSLDLDLEGLGTQVS